MTREKHLIRGSMGETEAQGGSDSPKVTHASVSGGVWTGTQAV